MQTFMRLAVLARLQSNPGLFRLGCESKRTDRRILWQQIWDLSAISKAELLTNPSADWEICPGVSHLYIHANLVVVMVTCMHVRCDIFTDWWTFLQGLLLKLFPLLSAYFISSLDFIKKFVTRLPQLNSPNQTVSASYYSWHVLSNINNACNQLVVTEIFPVSKQHKYNHQKHQSASVPPPHVAPDDAPNCPVNSMLRLNGLSVWTGDLDWHEWIILSPPEHIKLGPVPSFSVEPHLHVATFQHFGVPGLSNGDTLGLAKCRYLSTWEWTEHLSNCSAKQTTRGKAPSYILIGF